MKIEIIKHTALFLFIGLSVLQCNEAKPEQTNDENKSGVEIKNQKASIEKKLWSRLEIWINKNVSEADFGLNPGATDEDFKRLEKLIKKELPEDFKRFYRIHNGQNQDPYVPGLIDTELLLSISQIESEWKSWKNFIDNDPEAKNTESEPQKGIKPDWWNEKWIPITSAGTGDYTCIDLDPTEEGKNGQIIRMIHDDVFRELISPSFTKWFKDYVEKIENGEYIYSKEWGGIINKEEAI